MVRLYQDHIVETTSPEGRVWENPDPRVKWALDILEPEGETESLFNRFMSPVLGGISGFLGVFTYNRLSRRPVYFNLVGYVAMTGIGALAGESIYRHNKKKRGEEMAIYKHYLMMHPEKFPEPELIKFGDKRMFHTWAPTRYS